MGVIQNAINKVLGTAALATRLSQELSDRQKKAMENVAKKQDAQQIQRRNFKNYLRKQPISGGGTVGQLPKQMQNIIAKQYSKAERKQLMDTMDKEKKKNGK